ncbi:hypothetical protein ACH5RR_008216 [Cinchona calisaya]|uniref:Uncharacterized protein n=1 Tax=Cinchona calisaya TaxID=153742 RepID=A0ABD3AB55_9GENT
MGGRAVVVIKEVGGGIRWSVNRGDNEDDEFGVVFTFFKSPLATVGAISCSIRSIYLWMTLGLEELCKMLMTTDDEGIEHILQNPDPTISKGYFGKEGDKAFSLQLISSLQCSLSLDLYVLDFEPVTDNPRSKYAYFRKIVAVHGNRASSIQPRRSILLV